MMEQQLFLSCLALFVNKADCVNTNADNIEENDTEASKLPF